MFAATPPPNRASGDPRDDPFWTQLQSGNDNQHQYDAEAVAEYFGHIQQIAKESSQGNRPDRALERNIDRKEKNESGQPNRIGALQRQSQSESPRAWATGFGFILGSLLWIVAHVLILLLAILDSASVRLVGSS